VHQPSYRTQPFRELLSAPAGGETVRAFTIFGLLLLAVTAIAAQLAFRELSLKVLSERLDLGRHEAERIARAVSEIGRDVDGGIDFSLVRRNEQQLERMILQRISSQVFIHHVEIRDRFQVRQLWVAREGARPPVRRPALGGVPVDWPAGGEQIVSVPLQAAGGEVRLGVAQAPLLEELEQLRNSLRFKVAIAAGLAVILLIAGLFYVLHLIRKNRTLEQSRQSAARASYVGLLASGLAHEIRNPLNAMSMNLQMLEEELMAGAAGEVVDHTELLESSKREIKRLERLVNNFLAFARPAPPRFEPRDLNAIVGEVLTFLEADFSQSGVELRQELEPLLPQVEIDETQFKQALINLLVNARQVLEGGGVVTVRTRAGAGGEVVLEVQDDGPGIPPELRERIFEVFYSRRGGGTGLGLPIARQVIERHGGTIEIDSEQSRGTTFRIRLLRRHRREPGLPKRAEGGS